MAFDLDTKISLQELSSALEQELLNHDVSDKVYQVAIYSCRQELRYLKGVLDTNASEREKFVTVHNFWGIIKLIVHVTCVKLKIFEIYESVTNLCTLLIA